MTKKLFRWLSLVAVFMALLWSCRQEELLADHDHDDGISKTITIQQLLKADLVKIPHLQNEISKLENRLTPKSSPNGKIYTDAEEHFSIDTEKALYIQDTKGNKTYTFRIIREENNSGALENLILQDTGNSEFETYISTYDQTALQNYKNLSLEELKAHVTMTPIGKRNASDIFGKPNPNLCQITTVSNIYEIYVPGTICSESLHNYSNIADCTAEVKPTSGYYTFATEYITYNSCTGTTGSGTVNTGPYGGYNGGGGSFPTYDDPCTQIKKSTNDSKYKGNIIDLEGKTGLDHEEGYRLGTPISGTGQTGTQNQLLQNLPGTKQVDLKIFNNTFALMHTHYDGLYPIFSPGDILLFNQWVVWANSWNAVPTNTPKIPLNNLTLTVVTSNGNYLLAFDGAIVDALPTYTQEEFEDLNDKYKTKYLDNANNNGNFNMERLEKEFLKFVNEKMNMTGLKLYRVKSDGNYEISLSDLEGTKCP